MKNTKPIPKGYSSRKGCFWCKQPLNTLKEKILRTCDDCARQTLKAANKMSSGDVKEGFKELKEKTIGGTNPIMEKKIEIALERQERKIIKKAKRKGLTDEEIKESLEIFRSAQ